MDKFRKWLNKPKADDKSLLARFFHADRALIAVASELDSFDGRAEPDRCSRLVSRLRQGQDKVLSITNQIMEELLGEDRAARAFRAKFPEEVLQENLAGQLWFGAECLAAGSSIMNREIESTAMRPLAQAVTKSLDNVRNLLRDQCLRNNVPNSQTLPLDFNNSTTEQLYESLKIFDRLFAEFELRYVSAMVQVKTKHEYEMQEFICVLFSETLQRALLLGLLEQDQVDAFDPALMFSIPRLAIISGLVIYCKGPLNMDMPADQLSDMFRPFRTILIKIRDLLKTLSRNELFQLEKLLCTNEDMHLQVLNVNNNNCVNNNINNNNNSCDDINDNGNDGGVKSISPSALSNATESDEQIVCNGNLNLNIRTTIETTTSPTTIRESDDYNGYISSLDSSPSSSPPIPSSSSGGSSAVDTSSDWTDDESIGKKLDKEENLVHGDCATGFLIPNTNFGNLLQANEAPLTENFIASDDEDFCSSGAGLPQHIPNNNNPIDSGFSTNNENTGSDRTPDSNCYNSSCPNKSSSGQIYSSYTNSNGNFETSTTAAPSVVVTPNRPSCSRLHISTAGSGDSEQLLTIHATPTFDNIDTTKSCLTKLERQQTSRRSSRSSSNHRYHHHQSSHHHHLNNNNNINNNNNNNNNNPSSHHSINNHNGGNCTSSSSNISNGSRHHSKKRSKNCLQQKDHQQQNQNVHIRSSLRDTSGEDTSSSCFDGESQETTTVSLKVTGRTKFRSTENLLHRLFVCIAGVADQLQTNFASDLRQILRSVFLMNMSPAQEDIKIPEKTKESELFEFRASENDVIQESAGSNQSIYSAEEATPDLDNVFASNEQRPSVVIQRGSSVDSSTIQPSLVRSTMGRSRSLGEENSDTSTPTNNIVGRRSTTPSNFKFVHERRTSEDDSNSAESHSPLNSSASNSPVSGRSSNYYTDETAVNNNRSRSNSNTIATNAQTQTTTPSSSPPTTNYNTTSQIRMLPPIWIPDEEASRCMACTIPFTAFRRRHHCRNCGGVFCGGCSNSSAPLPKYGLTKAVRVCRECYVQEVVAV